jgi:hypothetical protein
MKVKMTGHEFKAFMDDEEIWANKKFYYDDAYVTVNGIHSEYGPHPEKVPEEAEVVIEGGFMVWQGLKDPEDGIFEKDFVGEAKKFLKGLKTATVVIEVEKEHLANFLDYIKQNKDIPVKVLK